MRCVALLLFGGGGGEVGWTLTGGQGWERRGFKEKIAWVHAALQISVPKEAEPPPDAANVECACTACMDAAGRRKGGHLVNAFHIQPYSRIRQAQGQRRVET